MTTGVEDDDEDLIQDPSFIRLVGSRSTITDSAITNVSMKVHNKQVPMNSPSTLSTTSGVDSGVKKTKLKPVVSTLSKRATEKSKSKTSTTPTASIRSKTSGNKSPRHRSETKSIRTHHAGHAVSSKAQRYAELMGVHDSAEQKSTAKSKTSVATDLKLSKSASMTEDAKVTAKFEVKQKKLTFQEKPTTVQEKTIANQETTKAATKQKEVKAATIASTNKKAVDSTHPTVISKTSPKNKTTKNSPTRRRREDKSSGSSARLSHTTRDHKQTPTVASKRSRQKASAMPEPESDPAAAAIQPPTLLAPSKSLEETKLPAKQHQEQSISMVASSTTSHAKHTPMKARTALMKAQTALATEKATTTTAARSTHSISVYKAVVPPPSLNAAISPRASRTTHGDEFETSNDCVSVDDTLPLTVDSKTHSIRTGTSRSTRRRYRSHAPAASIPAKSINDEYFQAMEEKLKLDETVWQSKQDRKSRRRERDDASQITVEQLPWTSADHDFLRDQVTCWKDYLTEDVDDNDATARVPKEEIREMLKSLYSVLRKDRIRRSDPILNDVALRLSHVQALDLHRLLALMDTHLKAGDILDDKTVILLTGVSGSGKTTTLHYLAGTEFEETEVDGFIHLEPVNIKDPRLRAVKTSCGRDPLTKKLNVISLHGDNKEDQSIVICDTPGFGISVSPEEEIAFCYGMGRSLDRARRIKPVLVLNQELMGSYFSNLPETLHLMRQEVAIRKAADLEPLDYVFANYGEAHRTRLCQQIASLQSGKLTKTHKESNNRVHTSLVDNFIDDIIEKTTPKAKLAMPLESGSHEALLDGLISESSKFVDKTEKFYFSRKISGSAEKLLNLQLQITLEELKLALSREVYSVALNRMVTLDKLSAWLPQAKRAALQAKEAASRQVKLIWDWMAKEICLGNYEQALCRMEQMSDFGLIFPDAFDCSKFGHDLLWESLVAPMDEDHNYVLAMERIGKLSALKHRFEEANSCVKRAMRLLRKKVEVSIIEEGHFKDAVALLVPLSSLQEAKVPEAGDCAKKIVSNLKQLLDSTISKKDYRLAFHMIRKFKSVQVLYPQVGKMADRGVVLCREMVESSVQNGEYDSALFLVHHMQQLEVEFPQAGEIAEYGLEIFGKAIEVLLEYKNYKKAVPLMKKLCIEVPGTSQIVLKGLSMIKEDLREAIRDSDFQFALDTIYEVNELTKAIPQADAVIEFGFNALEESILSAIEHQEYQSAIHLMELLSGRDNRLPLANECTRVGIEVLKRNVNSAIQKKKYSPALDMIQQLGDKGDKIPEVGECSRRGLEMLKATALQAIKDRDYSTAIEIITNLSELTSSLPEAKACTLFGIQEIIQHIAELRQTVEKTVEELSQTKDLKIFVAMLLKLKSEMEKVMLSESLRKMSVQIHYKKSFRLETEPVTTETNASTTPQLYTSHAFCSDHVELLVVRLRDMLPDFDVQDGSMESLIRNRKTILSVMIRLKASQKILHKCPGGEKVSAVYGATFEQFQALVETVLSIAEDSFKPPIDMRLFELQTWFLSVLIKGFIKDKIDIDSDERKKMEDLEARRKVLMLQFELQVTDAIEILTDQDFIRLMAAGEDDNEKLEANSLVPTEADNDASVKIMEGLGEIAKGNSPTTQPGKTKISTTENDTKGEPLSSTVTVITSEVLHTADFSEYVSPRTVLLSMCERPEIFKMVSDDVTLVRVQETVQRFDRALGKYMHEMVRYGELEYDSLVKFACSGGASHLPSALQKANVLRTDTDKIESHIMVIRNIGPDLTTLMQAPHQRLLVLKKRVELAIEKLEAQIKLDREEIGFGAFVSNLAAPLLCNGHWYDDLEKQEEENVH